MTLGAETYNPFIHGERPAPPDAASRQEQYPDALSLPGNKELTDRLINEAQIALANKPIRQIPDFRQADLILERDNPTSELVAQEYAHKEGNRFAQEQWWYGLEGALKFDFNDSAPLALQVSREHRFDMLRLNNRGSEGSIKVYECGPGSADALTDQELESLQITLTIIDQLSSGNYSAIEAQPILFS